MFNINFSGVLAICIRNYI